ncbi:hypothetical protein GCM10022419_121850 [Nonomuraea rosea]|uniref:Uncharacterized protein n=1 Tax=Nonomuraea rosea TaxID=638574 RepID=A0ABP6ZSP5_9ACTN
MQSGGLNGCDTGGVHAVRLALGRAGIGEGSALFQRGAVECERGRDADRVAVAAADGLPGGEGLAAVSSPVVRR